MKFLDSIYRIIIPLLFHERKEFDTKGNTRVVYRGIPIEQLTRVFKNRNSLITFLRNLQVKLDKVGFSLKTLTITQTPYLTVASNVMLPSYLTDSQAFTLAVIYSLTEGKVSMTFRKLQAEINAMQVEKFNIRREIEALVNYGLITKVNFNPLKVEIGSLFYLEFSSFARNELVSLMNYHFLLGRGVES